MEQAPIIGIDLGTTHSLVAWVREGRPEVLRLQSGSKLFPSVVSWLNGAWLLGDAAKAQKVLQASHTIRSVKRFLGRKLTDLPASASHQLVEEAVAGGEVGIRLGDKVVSPTEISAMILRELKREAEKALGRELKRAVLTVPAYFNDAQRQATRTAGRWAGWEVVRILNEPTAAALAYGLDGQHDGLVAVYDLGGGTFDLSILKLAHGIFEVLSTHGDTALGGDDLDAAILAAMQVELEAIWAPGSGWGAELQATLLAAAEQVKIALATHAEASFTASWQGQQFGKVWSRADLATAIAPILERTRQPCLEALADAGLTREQLSQVILVGGPTRLSVVQEFVAEIFGRVPDASLHPEEVVAQGAAIQADILGGGNQKCLLLDVIPLTLGIETYGGLMAPLIARNTRIPAAARETFTTFADRQTGVEIHVLQGEREQVEQNRSLGRFKLGGLTPLPAGQARVEVSFVMDADGILQVSALDVLTGKEQAIEVKPSFGLQPEEIEARLAAGLQGNAEDQAFRERLGTRQQAEALLQAVLRQWPSASAQLEAQEVSKIQGQIDALEKALRGDEISLIASLTSDLNQATVDLAGRLLASSLNQLTKREGELKPTAS